MFDTEKPITIKHALVVAEVVLILILTVTVPFINYHDARRDNVSKAFYGINVGDCFAAEGYGLYVDGELLAVCENQGYIETALGEITSAAAEAFGAPDGVHSLRNDISIVSGAYSKSMFTDADGVCYLLGRRENGFSFDVCKLGGIVTDLRLSLSTTATIKTEEVAKAPMVSVGTDLLPVGETLTVMQGTDGVCVNEYRLTYIDGEQTERVLTGSTVISAPVAGEEWYGTKSGTTLMSAGDKLMLPVSGFVTSWYGGRELWGSAEVHHGIDFAGDGARYGDPIYAAADGIVSFAAYHGGFGNKIIIDHTKELSTLYAHCSKFAVEEGDYVLKGQLIGYIGSTGRVTGPHLHLEVLLNGDRVNPKPYLDWSGYQWGTVE